MGKYVHHSASARRGGGEARGHRALMHHTGTAAYTNFRVRLFDKFVYDITYRYLIVAKLLLRSKFSRYYF
eukprot:SAG31_NODE_14605_length_797_cov_0.881089_1_plen_70_part_00